MNVIKILLISCIFLLISNSFVLPNTILIPDNQTTIQAGIDAASTNDTVLIAVNTYSGTGNVNLSVTGKVIKIIGQSGAGSTIIDCEDLNDGFSIISSGSEVRGVTIQNAINAINCGTSNPIIDSNIIKDNEHGILLDPEGSPNLFDNNYLNNTYGIAVNGGYISSESITWHNDNGEPYIILGDIAIDDNVSGNDLWLNIEPGVEIRFTSGTGLQFGYTAYNPGRLNAVGTPDSMIIFTSLSGLSGDWKGLYFPDRSDDHGKTSTMEYCIVENAGQTGWGSEANIYCFNTSTPTISNCIIRNSSNDGIYLGGVGSPNITNTTFQDNGQFAIQMALNASPVHYGNIFINNGSTGIGIQGGSTTISSNTWYYDNGEPYIILGDVILEDIIVSYDSWLNIQPGVEVRFTSGTGMKIGDDAYVPGRLNAVGTPDSMIIFTSESGLDGDCVRLQILMHGLIV